MVVGRGSWVQSRGSWVQSRGSWVVGRGSWVVGRGSWVVGRGSWVPSRGLLTLLISYWYYFLCSFWKVSALAPFDFKTNSSTCTTTNKTRFLSVNSR